MPVRHRFRLAAAVVAAAAALALTGCASGGGATSSTPAAGGDAFPVSFDSNFGTTKIDAQPKRVATWGWGSTEAALAVGVVPVAIAQQTYGANSDGVLPWVAKKLDELGAKTPAILTDDGETVPYEEVIKARPDVILAPYSGLTKEQFDTLSDIAPVVAFTGEAWTTPWRDVITTVGKALGKADKAKDVLASLDDTLSQQADAHPELAGKSVAAVWDVSGTFYVYKEADPRVEFLTNLGLKVAPAVKKLDNGDQPFYYTLSYEQLDKLDSDIVVSYSDNQEAADAFLASPTMQALPAVARGAVAQVVGTEFVAAVSPPTALSLTWGLDDLVSALSAAAQKA
ncbi:iron-siderophore ABC transporter substrate-binding protein [Rathayibacter sp. YIM 133350]|uniref:iron-siderophore ABC transporter substrate-binding protein n=1 Tax=Rathayibacter sp. YIM 133350 TaxID=3131992 RepID=UPI00307F373A